MKKLGAIVGFVVVLGTVLLVGRGKEPLPTAAEVRVTTLEYQLQYAKGDCAVTWTRVEEGPGRTKLRNFGVGEATVSWWVVSWAADGMKEQPTCRELCEPDNVGGN